MKKQIQVRQVKIGGGAPVAVQSMLNVHTEDVEACLAQIRRLEDAGCDIVRLAVPTMEAAAAFGEIRKQTDMPLVADIHFDYRLAVAAVENGADKIRINPGNIGDDDRVKAVVDACKDRQIPIRVGVNSGSLEKDLLELYGPTARALAESALRNVRRLEEMDFTDIAVSLKSSDVPTTIEAYRLVDKACEYPLHIGVTEAGTRESGIIKSAVGLGTLLMDGIGDTMRVSLTGDPAAEVTAARKILAACGREKEPINIVSCPTCGRTKVDLETIVLQVEQALAPIARQRQEEGKRPLTVAVMGCEVNGPGEAREADLGVAGGNGKGLLFRKGEKLKVVDESEITSALVELVKHYEDI